MQYELLADEVLLRLLKDSDEKAFEAIFNRYWEKIFLSAYKKVRSKTVAQDLTQSLFATLWEKRHKYNIQHLAHYLSIGIKNRVVNHINAEIVRSSQAIQLHEGADKQNSSDQLAIVKDLQSAINRALNQLPQKTREIFTLSKFEKCSVRDIARQFDISEKAVEYHITQSNKIIGSQLKEFLKV
jgi:RNA polymerase sigma-70 factor (family 1)